MVVPDWFPAVARPLAAIVAVAVLLLAHVTVPVQGTVLLSLYPQVAVYCNVLKGTMLAFRGVTTMLVRVGTAGLTVNVSAGLTTLPMVAVIAVVPAATLVASPAEAMVAVPTVPDAQVLVAVQSVVLRSL